MYKIVRIMCRQNNNQFLKMSCVNFASFTRKSGFNLSDDHQSILQNLAASGYTIDSWKSLRQEIIESNRNVTKVNIDGVILNYYAGIGNIEAAKSYLTFLGESEGNIALLIKVIFLKIYHSAILRGYTLSKDDEQHIKEIVEEVTQKYEVLDYNTSESIILGLSLTPYWKEGLKFLEQCKLSATPSRVAYGALIRSAFNHDDPHTVLMLANEIVKKGQNPAPAVYENWIDWCVKKPEFQENIEVLLKFMEEAEIVMPAEATTKFIKVLEDKSMHVKPVNITKKGICNYCKKYLNTTVLTDDEFSQLQSTFLEKVLIRNDVYMKTNPKELENFQKFIEKNAPYDCVIDGLNVAYSSGVEKSPKVCATLLMDVVTYLSKTNKRILVLGREHMLNWPKPQMQKIQKIANLFLTKDLSQDDPFLLYACLKSGPKSNFCSRDLMRSHAHLMGVELKPVFQKWRQQHQYQLVWAGSSQNVVISSPCLYKTSAHKVDNIWHVPYVDDQKISLDMELSTEEKKWFCIQV